MRQVSMLICHHGEIPLTLLGNTILSQINIFFYIYEQTIACHVHNKTRKHHPQINIAFMIELNLSFPYSLFPHIFLNGEILSVNWTRRTLCNNLWLYFTLLQTTLTNSYKLVQINNYMLQAFQIVLVSQMLQKATVKNFTTKSSDIEIE